MTTIFTKELVAQAMPPNLKNSVTQELIDNLNSVSTDQIMAEEIRNNFLSYSSVLREGGVIADGLDAELDELRGIQTNCGDFLLALGVVIRFGCREGNFR